MGTWDTGIFDNDNACDWADELEETDDLSLVEETLEKALESGTKYLWAPDAEEALAAAEVVARLSGNWGPRNNYTSPVDAWVERVKLPVDASLREKALAAIARVLTRPSELLELWEDPEGLAGWKRSVADLERRLRA